MKKQFISWRRVSTFKQNRSGLGLEAQKEIIRYFVERDNGELVADYSECYTGKELSGCKELRKAMQHAKNIGAVLVIAKSDRFRNCQEALGILDEMGEGHLEFCDLPHSDRFTLTLFWALAEREALITSIRTKQALAALKARGEVKLGAANEKFQANRAKKEKEVLLNQYNKMGNTKRTRFQESFRVRTFLRILQQIFPDATTNEDPHKWEWKLITTKGDNKDNILKMMKTMRDLDDSGHLWHKWDFDADERLQQQRLAAHMHSIKRTFMA